MPMLKPMMVVLLQAFHEANDAILTGKYFKAKVCLQVHLLTPLPHPPQSPSDPWVGEKKKKYGRDTF